MMEKEIFEEQLMNMTIPGVNQLKHQDMLAKAIANAKDKTVLSWWWLIIPLYIISMLLMKSLFMPNETLSTCIRDLTEKQEFVAYTFFLILPIILILINIFSIRKVYFLSGNPNSFKFVESLWPNVLIILFSIMILIIYLL